MKIETAPLLKTFKLNYWNTCLESIGGKFYLSHAKEKLVIYETRCFADFSVNGIALA